MIKYLLLELEYRQEIIEKWGEDYYNEFYNDGKNDNNAPISNYRFLLDIQENLDLTVEQSEEMLRYIEKAGGEVKREDVEKVLGHKLEFGSYAESMIAVAYNIRRTGMSLADVEREWAAMQDKQRQALFTYLAFLTAMEISANQNSSSGPNSNVKEPTTGKPTNNGGNTGGGNKFANESLLDSHYKKHGKEFGNITKSDYLKQADRLVNSTGNDILTKTRSNGDILYYNKAVNEFAVKTPDGIIRTYFKPIDGIDYFNRQ